MRKIFPFLLIILFFLFCVTQNSLAFELGMPIKCNYGEECFIQNYFDEDSGAKALDYRCGHLTYDGHDGTDFRIRNYSAMRQGVEVIAAAAGVVKAVRDQMEDVNVNKIGKDTVMKQGCGNAVVLTHEEGYSTLYCHMKKGSVAVKAGDKVEKGQKLGEVGLSGLTEFPHVHLGVLREGKKIDPFTGGSSQDACAVGDMRPLWDKETAAKLAYIPTALLGSAFSTEVPEPEAARDGKFSQEKAPDNAAVLVIWADLLGLQQGDDLSLKVMAPDGALFVEKHFRIDRDKAVFFQFIGKKRTKPQWDKGTYIGKILLQRQGKTIIEKESSIVVGDAG